MTRFTFSGQEILKMAIQIEENGKAFYNFLQEDPGDEEMSSTFKYLAEQEEKHKQTFQEMLEKVQAEKTNLSFQIYGELEDLYLKALADSTIFAPANENIKRAREASGRVELLKIAIDLEMDSILYYYQMLEVVPNPDKEMVKKVIEEEKDHVRDLVSLQ